MMNEKLSVIVTDADGLADNSEAAFVIISIPRKDIQGCQIGNTLEILHTLIDSPENTRRYRESVVFQVDGYNDDPRELPEIPEVKRYFRRLTDDWPHWMWFLARNFGAVALLMSLLCDVRVVRQPDGSYGTEFLDTRQAETVILDLFRRGNALFMAHSIRPDEAEASADSAVAEFGLG